MPCHIIGVSQPAIRGDTPKVTTKNEMKGQALSALRNTVNAHPIPAPVMTARPTLLETALRNENIHGVSQIAVPLGSTSKA